MTKIVTKNSSTASSVPTAAQLVQGELAVNVADKRLYTEDNVGAIVELGTNPSTLTVTGEITANGGIALGDNDKATFGVGDDLAIYHDGGNSLIEESGVGNLIIRGSGNVDIQPSGGGAYMARFAASGSSSLYYNGGAKLATTSTGIDVTGTVVADGLTVDGAATIQGTTSPSLRFLDTNAANSDFTIYSPDGDNSLRIKAGSSQNDAFEISSNGDVSFYEDTGSTPKMVWDASAESLGIGAAPTNVLHVKATADTDGATIIGLSPTATNNIQGGLGCLAGGELQVIGTNQTTFWTAATQRMAIDSSGNVGIGTDSPAKQLHQIRTGNASDLPTLAAETGFITQSTNATASSQNISIFSGNIGEGRLFFGDTDDEDIGSIVYNHASNYLTFGTNGAERFRVDSSGNLLVGTTDNNPVNNGTGTSADDGVVLGASGTVAVARYNNTPLFANRTGTDGDIVDFRKDGSTVGSIGTVSGDIRIGGLDDNHAALRFAASTKAVLPVKNSDGGLSDNTTDLGSSGARFKDLYLSGGVYLGGTGAANKLDDYEEGTFTPAMTFGGGAVGLTYSAARGSYTKVGNLVTIQIGIDVNSKGTSSGSMQITGLPFASATISGGYSASVGAMRVDGGWTGLTGATAPYVNESGSTTIDIRQGTGTGTSAVTEANILSGYFFLSATYFAA
jgi:hypothetical protein